MCHQKKKKKKKKERKKSSQFNSGTRSFTKSIASNGQRGNHWYDRGIFLSQASSLLHLIRKPDTLKPGALPTESRARNTFCLGNACKISLPGMRHFLKFKTITTLTLIARGIYSCDEAVNIIYPTSIFTTTQEQNTSWTAILQCPTQQGILLVPHQFLEANESQQQML